MVFSDNRRLMGPCSCACNLTPRRSCALSTAILNEAVLLHAALFLWVTYDPDDKPTGVMAVTIADHDCDSEILESAKRPNVF